jgi:hypothetical protein
MHFADFQRQQTIAAWQSRQSFSQGGSFSMVNRLDSLGENIRHNPMMELPSAAMI